MIIQIVRYKSRLPHDDVARRFEERSGSYRSVPGLLQKYYVRFPASDDYGGLYVWDSEDSLRRWQEGPLAGTLAQTYEVIGPPTVELADVMLVLHPEQVVAS